MLPTGSCCSPARSVPSAPYSNGRIRLPRRRRYLTWKRLKYALFLIALTNAIFAYQSVQTATQCARGRHAYLAGFALKGSSSAEGLTPLTASSQQAPQRDNSPECRECHAKISKRNTA